jgi:hypothetical protein
VIPKAQRRLPQKVIDRLRAIKRRLRGDEMPLNASSMHF